MNDSVGKAVLSIEDTAFFREQLKRRVYAQLKAFFLEETERSGLTKAVLAKRLNKDPAIITRLFSSPSNMTLETLSDLLLAMGAEAGPPAITRLSEHDDDVRR